MTPKVRGNRTETWAISHIVRTILRGLALTIEKELRSVALGSIGRRSFDLAIKKIPIKLQQNPTPVTVY